MRIYDRALSGSEVLDLFNLESSRSSANVTESWTFTNAGANGRFGPTQQQIDSAYVATNLANKVSINTQGIQEWIVPQTGKYKIEAWGAQGGSVKVQEEGSRMSGIFSYS